MRMSLYEPFGAGDLYVPASGGFQHVEDRIVPNDLLADWQTLREGAKAHPTVPEFLRRYERRRLAFSRTPECFRRPIEASFHEGDTVMACEATYEGVRHFFLSQPLRRSLRASGLSVVRDSGTYALPVLDTRTVPFELPRNASKPALAEWTFSEDLPTYGGIATDFVTASADLVFYLDALEARLIGAARKPTPLREFLGPAHEGEPGWGDGLAWETRGQPILAASLAGAEGWRTFLTREGFQRLRDRDLTVVRALRSGKEGPWERLEVHWSPREGWP